MRIKQVIPVTPDYAVLATRKSDFATPCYDQQDSGHSFFWAVMDEGYKDTIALIDVDVNGRQRICERRLVVPRKACPFCSQQMEPVYGHKKRNRNGHVCIHYGICYGIDHVLRHN